MSSPLGFLTNIETTKYVSRNPYISIFNDNKFYYRPVSNNVSADPKDIKGRNTTDIYDTSIPSIIAYTDSVRVGNAKPMLLKNSDFAYLKDLGLYPNNRLIVCRRFKTGVENDLTIVGQNPMSTIVSWIPDGQEIMKFKFGEQWNEANPKDPIALFDSVFKAGTGTTVGGGLSGIGDAVTKVIPFGGVSEALQIELMKQLGIETDLAYNNLPSGNPNFISDAKMRGGLTSDISFEVETTYEQKFYGKVDPSIVFLDLINNILRFGSSESAFYILGAGNGKIKKATDAFTKGEWAMGAGIIIGAFVNAIKSLVSGIGSFIKKTAADVVDIYNNTPKVDEKAKKTSETNMKDARERMGLTDIVKSQGIISGFSTIIDGAMNLLGTVVVAKYRLQIAAVISAMTGNPSTPWHVTIGNPKKPIFSSGDMYIRSGITVEMGSILAYNDLPNSIKISFTIESARTLGIQEIFERFNVGGARVYNKNTYINRTKDFFESPVPQGTASFNEGYKIGQEPTKE